MRGLRYVPVVALLMAALVPAPAPAQPQGCLDGLVSHALPDGSVQVEWPHVDTASSYEVLQRPEGGTWTAMPVGDATQQTIASHPGQALDIAVAAYVAPGQPVATFCPAKVTPATQPAKVPPIPPTLGAIMTTAAGAALVGVLVPRRGPPAPP